MMIHPAAAEVKPAAVLLFDSSRLAARKPFGRGVLASMPAFRATTRTVSDEAWWASECARRDADDRFLDRMYEESDALARVESGYAAF